MEYKNSEEILFVIAVYGYAPEFWPPMAFRRDGGKGKKQPEKEERKKEIKCPYCGKLFMVVNEKRKLDLIRFPAKMKADCHEYRKCRKCHENVGVLYVADGIPA
jgi:ssDNA-binding Zn-finger/Zn-ribbon topoisomerase 1